MNNNDELDIQHRVLIEEEDIDVSELPREIQIAMRDFNKKLVKYEETGSEELFFQLQQDDVAIADDIQTFIEDNESDEEDEDDTYVDDDEENEEKKSDSTNAVVATNNVSLIENKIRESLKNNLISVEDLQKILSREPDYPTEKVGNLKLRKLYLKPFYEAF
jgi:hypothetical protein